MTAVLVFRATGLKAQPCSLINDAHDPSTSDTGLTAKMRLLSYRNTIPRSSKLCTEASMAEPNPSREDSRSGEEKDAKAPNIIVRAKEEIKAMIHSPKHHTETHGTSDDIDENTSTDEVKGPNMFERVKEEVEAVAEAIHLTKDSKNTESSSK